jgi:pyruvate/2-oxoglutarate dehydrogenase complex dihydrolipoamide acyltransferase (E2) component
MVRGSDAASNAFCSVRDPALRHSDDGGMISIKVPPLGESIVEATIARWLKKEGDVVAQNESLVELETDKITVEVPAFKAGVLTKQAKKEGDVVHVGEEIGEIDESAGAGAGAFAGAFALSSICPISSPTCTTSPSFFPCFVSTPALNAGTSTVILSVSSSTSDSFCATTSPSFFNHREIVASTIDSPSGGTLIEIIPPSSECRKSSAGTEDIALLAAPLPLTIRYSI